MENTQWWVFLATWQVLAMCQSMHGPSVAPSLMQRVPQAPEQVQGGQRSHNSGPGSRDRGPSPEDQEQATWTAQASSPHLESRAAGLPPHRDWPCGSHSAPQPRAGGAAPLLKPSQGSHVTGTCHSCHLPRGALVVGIRRMRETLG